jgi:hypothetical protein
MLTLSTMVIKTNQLVTYKAKVADCLEISLKQATQSEYRVEFFNVKAGVLRRETARL